MRPIDADELQKQISSRFFATNYYSDFYKLVDSMPTVEQKHGHWIVRTIFGNGCREIRCSECFETGFWRNQPLYCPRCGAKMDEVSK